MDIKPHDRIDVYHYRERLWESQKPLKDQIVWFYKGTSDPDFGHMAYNVYRSSDNVNDKKDYFPFVDIRKWTYDYSEQVLL